MPCSDSSSSIALTLDHNEEFKSFEFAKITCGREITAQTGYSEFCLGKTLITILAISLNEAINVLKIREEDKQFILYLEWDTLRCAIAQYLGLDEEGIDRNRCQITTINYDEEGYEIAMVILPPAELPKILPCSLADN